MARLHSLNGVTAVKDPVHGSFKAGPDGAFDFPDELSDRLHSFHHRKKRTWETEIERDERLHGEESGRRRDPETLYNAVADIANIAKQLAALRLDAPDAAQGDVAKLGAQVEALTAKLAEMEARSASPVGGEPAAAPDGEAAPAPPKPARTPKPPAAKTAAQPA